MLYQLYRESLGIRQKCPIYLRYKEKINKINQQILGASETEHKSTSEQINKIRNFTPNDLPDLMSYRYYPSVPKFIRQNPPPSYEEYLTKSPENIKMTQNLQYPHVHLFCRDKNNHARCLCVPGICKLDTNVKSNN